MAQVESPRFYLKKPLSFRSFNPNLNLPSNMYVHMASRLACKESDNTARNQSLIAQSLKDEHVKVMASVPFLEWWKEKKI